MPKRKKLITVLVALFIFQGLFSQALIFPLWKKHYSTGNVGVAAGLTADQLLASLGGLRQFVAGILWVQGDEFFDTGQFDAVLPIIRLVTILDPKQIEVYATGAWHIAYNFTDEQNRSDRRYIPLALRLLEEGVQHNPDTYRLYHETGWLYFHKIEDNFDTAAKWFEKSVSKPDVLPFLKSILASTYLKAGKLDDAMSWYRKIELDAEKRLQDSDEFYDRQLRDTIENNLNNLLVRMATRGVFARRDGAYDDFPYFTHNPVDLNFTFRIEMVSSKVMRVRGTWGIPTTGARVRITVRDEDYNLLWEAAPALDFEIDKNKTFMYDTLYTLNRRFDRRVDMSRNPTMYPFKSNKYIVEFSYSPRVAPHHIQDKIGWDGEGMTDKRFLKIDERYNNIDGKPGIRVLYARVELPREFFLRSGDYTYAAIYESDGFVEQPGREEEDIIQRRSLIP
jgi:tetratricopeptide (TPR) repeat protein